MTKIHWRLVSNRLLVDIIKGNMRVLMACCHAGIFFFYYFFKESFYFDLEYSQLTRLPRWLSGKESTCQRRNLRRHVFDPWVGKIPLEKEMATHSSILAGLIPRMEGLGGLHIVHRHD